MKNSTVSLFVIIDILAADRELRFQIQEPLFVCWLRLTQKLYLITNMNLINLDNF